MVPQGGKILSQGGREGDADAQVGLGVMYFSGAIEDHAEAVKWYR